MIGDILQVGVGMLIGVLATIAIMSYSVKKDEEAWARDRHPSNRRPDDPDDPDLPDWLNG